MIKLQHFKIPKSELLKLPKRELSIVLCGGKIFNELTICLKLAFSVSATFHDLPDDTTETNLHSFLGEANGAAIMSTLSYLLRNLAGHCFEANEFFKTVVRMNELKYPDWIATDELEASIKKFNKYFGKSNILHAVRNHSAFHTNEEYILKAFDATDSTHTYDFMLGDRILNNLYHGSDLLITAGVSHLLPDATFNTVLDETREMAVLMLRALETLMANIIFQHLKYPDDQYAELELVEINTSSGFSLTRFWGLVDEPADK